MERTAKRGLKRTITAPSRLNAPCTESTRPRIIAA
jgi:hypothetical protein